MDALFLPSAGACKRLDALPLAGTDLFAGKFQESMEAEAKRLKAADKINLTKPQATTPKAKKQKQASFVIPRRRSQKPARGGFRGRADTAGARTQTQGQQRPRAGRGFRASTPRYPGAWRK